MKTQCDGYCGSLLVEKKIGRCPALGRDSLRAAERDVREVWREASLPEHHCHVQRHTGNLCVVITAVHVTELLSHLSALLLSHPGRMVIRSCDRREQTMAKAGWGKWTNEKKRKKKCMWWHLWPRIVQGFLKYPPSMTQCKKQGEFDLEDTKEVSGAVLLPFCHWCAPFELLFAS